VALAVVCARATTGVPGGLEILMMVVLRDGPVRCRVWSPNQPLPNELNQMGWMTRSTPRRLKASTTPE